MTSHRDRDITERCRLARALAGSALVQLRHRAPVGHGFGVPSRLEVAEAWHRSRQAIGARGGLGEAALAEDDYPLPGLPSLLSAIAGGPLTPDTLLQDTRDEIVHALDPQGTVALT
jgi:hypothetical protein